jgi:hypothetical protein
MRKVLLAGCLIGFLAAAGVCYGQTQGIFGIYGGLSMPMGDFGDDKGADAGLATMGFGVGAEFSAPLGSPGLYWTVGGAVVRNGVDDSEIEEQLEDMFGGYDIYGDANVDIGSWMSIPIMGGLKYRSPISPTSSLYMQGQLGMAIVMAPKWDISMTVYDYYYDEYYDVEEEVTWDTATSMCFALGGGIVIGEQFSVGFRYISLGEVNIDGDMEVCATDPYYGTVCQDMGVEIEQPISMFLLIVGMEF